MVPGMERTDAEVGQLLKQRRNHLGLRQTDLPDVSAATVGPAERGFLPKSGLTRSAYARALQWPPDAIDRLVAGDDLDEATDHVAIGVGRLGDQEGWLRVDSDGPVMIEDAERTIEIIKVLLRDRPLDEAQALVRAALEELESAPAEQSPADT